MNDDLSVRFNRLVSVSVPLMISAASQSLMMFCDRAFLAHHSLEAMNTSAAIWISTALLVFSLVAVCSVAEILAGQYNGQGAKSQVGRPVWMMIGFAGMMSFVTTALAFWGKSLFLPESLTESAGYYYELLMLGAPLWGMSTALSGFFAATGRPAVVTVTALTANLLNGVLDYGLIFGAGPFPSLGITGAAVATVSGQLLQVLLLLAVFLGKDNRRVFGTSRIAWSGQDLRRCIKIGFPNALSHGVEIAAWALLFRIMAGHSQAYLTVLTVCQSVMMLFSFLNDGLKQGVVALASNVLGSGEFGKISRLLKSGMLFQLLIVTGLLLPFMIFPEWSLTLLGGVGPDSELFEELRISVRLAWFFILFDGIVWVLNGIMTSGGDTRALMVLNILTVWILAILPSLIFLWAGDGPAWMIQLFPVVYASGNLIAHYFRYQQGRWQVQMVAE